MRYDSIPDELKTQKAWVNVWDSRKVPMQTTQRKAASASNPATWGTFYNASNNVLHKVYSGIGYVFHDTGLVGIDIDAGFEDGFLSPLAIDIMQRCKSYTEKSRSGRGIHILLKGDLPFKGKNNRQAVEIYKSCRYFIMTGNVLVFDSIIENQAAIDYVLEKYFSDVPKQSNTEQSPRAYSPVWHKPENGIISLRPDYPVIKTGCRNLSLTSLAGQMHTVGYCKADIYRELLYANQQACIPPLAQSEIESIVNSVTKYRR